MRFAVAQAAVMRHSDFKFRCEFRCGLKRWRCTDLGTRVVCAISISEHEDDPT